jgi:(S)-ureidoglycine aminohydrolase
LHHLGSTRSSLKHDHLLQTPDTFVRIPLPGAAGVEFIVHAGPQLGANFSQMTAEFSDGGTLAPASGQRFLYVLEGELDLTNGPSRHLLGPGGFAYLPPGADYTVTGMSAAKAALIEKIHEPIRGEASPEVIIGNESSIAEVPLMGDSSLRVRSLIPNTDAYDFAVNTMTYDPGAGLSMVEVHVMEHGLLMLEGGGIYRLGDSWYPVEAGDFIWMAPFCPQWFGAIGKKTAKYLIYKDWRRHPLGV